MTKAEFTRRVLAKQEMLYRISCGLLREPQDRMDAVQEAVLKAWSKLGQLRDPRYFETWLTRILINECHNLIARQSRILPFEAAGEPIAQQSENPELRDAILALEIELRLPVLLYYMEGYKLREVAQILQLPDGTVKTRLKRAREKLRGLLKEDLK